MNNVWRRDNDSNFQHPWLLEHNHQVNPTKPLMSSEPRLEISSSGFSLPPNLHCRPSPVVHQTSCLHSHFPPLVHTERAAEVDRSGLPPLICGGVRGCRYVARGKEKGIPSLPKRISPRNRWMLSQAVDCGFNE